VPGGAPGDPGAPPGLRFPPAPSVPTETKEVATMRKPLGVSLTLLGLALGGLTARAADTKIVLIAGRPSHGPGEHEFNAGVKLLAHCLQQVPGVEPVVVTGGWPQDEGVFKGAQSVVFFMDGGQGHPMIESKGRLETMRRLLDEGVGLVCLHYAVEVPKGEPGERFLEWLGGYYEPGYSDNPHNNVRVIPREDHPVTRGVRPFQANDEWYFKIRFRQDDPRVTPLLTARDLVGHDKKTYSEPQTVAWATERKDGGRSFGFTGAHFHKNWGIPEFRTLVLNAILWTARRDIPSQGIQTEVTPEELSKNLDPKGQPKGR
jgi:type 1 glutamine amidotransferase